MPHLFLEARVQPTCLTLICSAKAATVDFLHATWSVATLDREHDFRIGFNSIGRRVEILRAFLGFEFRHTESSTKWDFLRH